METTQIQPKKLPKLTKKRQKFVDHYVIDENGQEAAKKSFNVTNDNSARAVASELLTFPNVINAIEVKRESLKSALEKEGITPTYIAQKVNVLLKATDKEGNPDTNAVDKGIKHATNIYGIEDINDKPKSQNTYNFIFSPEVQQEVKGIEAIIKAKLLNKNASQNI